MAEQRGFGNTDKSPAEGGIQVRDRAQEASAQGRERTQEAGTQGHDRHPDSGTQSHDRNQESGAQGRDSTQEAGTQGRDSTQEVARHVGETASAYYQQGREQVAAVENSLEDSIRARPLQSIFMAGGLGMLLTLLVKKEDTAADYYRQGRQQAQDYYRQGRQQVAAVEHTLEEAMRTKPLQSLLIAAGCGMLLTLLLKK